jgi:alkylated DNA repair dioxygenase AlkB
LDAVTRPVFPLRLPTFQNGDRPFTSHAQIAEYKTGTQLGWHRDVPEFEFIVVVGRCMPDASATVSAGKGKEC